MLVSVASPAVLPESARNGSNSLPGGGSGNNAATPCAWGWEGTGSSGVPPELREGGRGEVLPATLLLWPSRPGPKAWGVFCEVSSTASRLGQQVCTSQHLAYLVARAVWSQEMGKSWKSLQTGVEHSKAPAAQQVRAGDAEEKGGQ